MRSADTILELIRERGSKRLPLERVYKLLFNRDLFLMAYGKIYRNAGAMTHGVTDETPDGMSLDKVDALIEALHHERYHWLPARRTHIPKKNGKKRPLGMPVWSDKLVQEVVRLLLEAYYEPQLSEHAHGFRQERSCATALREIYYTWAGTIWFIEGDIASCFDKLSHELLLDTLAENIHDGRFLRLMRALLDAGYMEDWTWNKTLSGVPQGGILSPLLSNILLDKLDKFVETVLIPRHTKGVKKRVNNEYHKLITGSHQYRRRGNAQMAAKLREQAQKLPSIDTHDPDYRRLKYVRYADDFLLGFVGPRSEAEEIKRELREYLRDELKLELSEEKTLITHAKSEAARFLGYEVTVQHLDTKRTQTKRKGDRRSINGRIGLRVPHDVIEAKCHHYLRGGKAVHRAELAMESDFTIVTTYQLEFRGLANYYRLAYNLHRLNRLKQVMEISLTKTLAHKFQVSVPAIYGRYGARLVVDGKQYKGLQVVLPRPDKKPLVAQWGGVSLAWDITASAEDQPPKVHHGGRSELVQRLLTSFCELCGDTEDVEVHHIRKMSDLHKRTGRRKEPWEVRMIALKRKTLVLCRTCHTDVDLGRPLRRAVIGLAEVKALRKRANATIPESRVR